MTTREMLNSVKQWTKISTEDTGLRALRKAYNWAVRRVYNSENGPNLVSTIGEELPALLATTKTYDFGANLAHPILGFKQLWVKLPADVKFTPMQSARTTDQGFVDSDSDPAASLQVAQGHPVLYDIINFDQARFAPALPTGAVLRVDYYRLAREVGETDSGKSDDSSDMNDEPVAGEDLPKMFDDCIVSKAIALLFNQLDDDREMTWQTTALSELNDALYIPKNPGPTRTTPYRIQRRRFI
jgi:hypothetical protein